MRFVQNCIFLPTGQRWGGEKQIYGAGVIGGDALGGGTVLQWRMLQRQALPLRPAFVMGDGKGFLGTDNGDDIKANGLVKIVVV